MLIKMFDSLTQPQLLLKTELLQRRIMCKKLIIYNIIQQNSLVNVRPRLHSKLLWSFGNESFISCHETASEGGQDEDEL